MNKLAWDNDTVMPSFPVWLLQIRNASLSTFHNCKSSSSSAKISIEIQAVWIARTMQALLIKELQLTG